MPPYPSLNFLRPGFRAVVLQAWSPPATRRAENSLIAFWQDRSALNVWAMNITNVSVGGSRRSRWIGNNDATPSPQRSPAPPGVSPW